MFGFIGRVMKDCLGKKEIRDLQEQWYVDVYKKHPGITFIQFIHFFRLYILASNRDLQDHLDLQGQLDYQEKRLSLFVHLIPLWKDFNLCFSLQNYFL